MIPNAHPYTAMYLREDQDGMRWLYKPIVAWDDDYQPLVVDLRHRGLARARDLEHFASIAYAPKVELPDGTITDEPEVLEMWLSDSAYEKEDGEGGV